jgi:hypothetical protein
VCFDPLPLTLLASYGDHELALKYFPPATPYLPDPHKVARFQKSAGYFDYGSIMIYPSTHAKTGDPNPKYIIKTIGGDFIFMGGHSNPEHAGLSQLDVSRVTALYPIKHVNPQSIHDKYPRKRLAVPDVLTTTTRPGPLTGASAEATNFSQQNDADAQLAKRWLSVPEDVILPDDLHDRAWPQGGDGRRLIHYCFEDAEAHKHIGGLFSKGLAKWEPAVRASSFDFAPDAACAWSQSPDQCLCSVSGVPEDTLRIKLNDSGSATATVGFKPPSSLDVPGQPRNYLQWPKIAEESSSAEWPLLMAHEIGEIGQSKVFGVLHMLTLPQGILSALSTSTNVLTHLDI